MIYIGLGAKLSKWRPLLSVFMLGVSHVSADGLSKTQTLDTGVTTIISGSVRIFRPDRSQQNMEWI
jgi:hypothetical protein